MAEWIEGPPSVEQVREHAEKYPIYYKGGGSWLIRGVNGARIQEMSDVMPPSKLPHLRYLPLTAEGLPVDYAETQLALANVLAAHTDLKRQLAQTKTHYALLLRGKDDEIKRLADQLVISLRRVDEARQKRADHEDQIF